MSSPSYLFRSPSGSYYFRQVLPPPAAALLGVKELRRSLGTRVSIEARRKALALFAEIQALTNSVTEKGLWPPIPPSLKRICRQRRGVQDASGDPRAFIASGLALYRKEHQHLWTAKTAQEVESILSRFEFRPNTSRADAVAHKESLQALNVRTLNKHLNRLRAVFGFLRVHGYFAGENPFDGLLVRERATLKQSESRGIWTDEQCRKLQDSGHWLGLLGLYTGARINELSQLRLDDIGEGIRICDLGPGQRLKNPASRRVIPIHSELVRRGFRTYIEERQREVKRTVFDFPLGRDGHGQAASRWFARYRQTEGFPDFHSLRHTVATKLRDAGVAEDLVAELLGHTKGRTMSFNRYAKESPQGVLQNALEKLSYG